MRYTQRVTLELTDTLGNQYPPLVRRVLLDLAERRHVPRCTHDAPIWACTVHRRAGLKCSACLQVHLGRRHVGEGVRVYEGFLYPRDSGWLAGKVRIVVPEPS